jgi:hypothetical protein
MQTKPLTQKEVLATILVITKYTLKVLGGFVISGIVSVFGLYPLVASFFKSETALYITLVGFIGLLILIDSIKRNTLSRYYNSKLKNIILGSKVRTGYLNISIMSILFVVLIDGSGAWLTGVTGATYYTENKAIQTEEYRNIEAGKENDSLIVHAYKSDLKAYEQREADYRGLCKDNLASGKWRDSVTKNMNSWYKKNSRPIAPKFASSGDVNKEFNSIKEDNKSFLDEYLQYIIFVVLMLLTGLLQYLTISEIKEDYEDLEDTLTPNRVSNLQTALSTAQDIEEQHEKTQFENKEKMQKKKNEQIRDMDGIADKREIVFNAKAISNGNEGLKRIATNTNIYVPTEEAKAGYVDVSFSSNHQKEENYQEEPKDFYPPTSETGIFDKLFLEKVGKESDKMKGANEKLNPKPKVIDITKRAEATALSRVYKKMVSREIAELRGNKGYYSLMGYSDAFLAFRVTEDKKETDTYDFNLGDY